jgi:hypothetical protein
MAATGGEPSALTGLAGKGEADDGHGSELTVGEAHDGDDGKERTDAPRRIGAASAVRGAASASIGVPRYHGFPSAARRRTVRFRHRGRIDSRRGSACSSRFDSGLRLNVHFHVLWFDGAYG